MSKKNYTHIVVVLDRSGSMSIICKDMRSGFDQFVEDQKKVEGEATLTLAQFDDTYEIVHDNIAIASVSKLNLEPRGSTALLDAMGRTLSTERDRINKMEESEAPEKVVVVIITDGEENASKEYSRSRVFDMIKDLDSNEDPQWSFVFLGANQDAISAGGNIGVRASASMTYDYSSNGTKSAYASLSKGMTSLRCCTSKSAKYEFDDEDRAIQEDLLKGVDKKFNKSIPTSISDMIDRNDDKV